MEHDFYEEEKNSSSKKLKRLGNKRERLQVKNYLKQVRSTNDFNDDDMDDYVEEEISYKN